MPAYSSSSQNDPAYSSPGPQQYTLVTPGMLRDPRNLSQVSPGFIYVIFPKSTIAFCVSRIAYTFTLFEYLLVCSCFIPLSRMIGPFQVPRRDLRMAVGLTIGCLE